MSKSYVTKLGVDKTFECTSHTHTHCTHTIYACDGEYQVFSLTWFFRNKSNYRGNMIIT